MLNNHTVSLIAAYTKNKRVIGSDGKIPWNLKSERNRFKQICNNKKIIMGRKSFEEIGRTLPYCTIIIISKTLDSAPEGCILARSLEEAIDKADSTDEIIIAGGGEIYEQTMPFADKIYATEIDADFEGNSYFPLPDGNWDCVEEKKCCENNICYRYLTFTRIAETKSHKR